MMQSLDAQKQDLERQNQQLLDAYAALDRVMSEYAELYDFAPVGYLALDKGRRIVKVNLTCCTLLGRERVVLIGKDFLDCLSKQDCSAFIYFFDKMLQGSGKEFEVRLHNGIWVRLEAVACEGRHGCRIALSDISRQKRAEEALRESEKRFKALVEVTSDWVWEVNENGVYTYVSPKVYDLLGYRPEEVLGKTPFDFMTDSEAERVLLLFGEKAARQEPFQFLENTNVRKDGTKVVLETSGVPVFDAAGAFCGYHGIDRDITERVKRD